MNIEYIRVIFFLGGFTVFFFWGCLFPFREPQAEDRLRWFNNIFLTLFNTLVIKIFFGVFLLQTIQWNLEHNLPVVNLSSLPVWLNVMLSVLIFDFVIYWQHLFFHRVPWLWKLHRVHHTDTNYDTTTALRFHTIEIILSIFVKAGVVLFFGMSMWSVIVFEVLLNFSAMFNHGNFSLNISVDRMLRKLIVTPEFHRVHHTNHPEEINSNYGFCLSIWDYLFMSYRYKPYKEQLKMKMGLDSFRSRKSQGFLRLLRQPFA